MRNTILKKYIKAGAVAHEIRKETCKQVVPGSRIQEICEFADRKTKEFGVYPAFPLNISLDSIAAHDTSAGQEDHRRIPEKTLVKIDVGVHVDGFIADCASTVSVGGQEPGLIEASEAGFQAALDNITDGALVSKIGSAVQKAIEENGYKPIKNLTGHEVKRYNLHAGIQIPSVPTRSYSRKKLREGMVIAIEPFATNGSAGHVIDAPKKPPLIFSVVEKEPGDTLVKRLSHRFGSLPFAARWAYPLMPKGPEKSRLKKLIHLPGIQGYPPFLEASRGLVAQTENTVIVKKNSGAVLTTDNFE